MDTEQWIHQSLSELLDFPVPNDLTQYILQISNDRDLDDYLRTLLDFDNRKHKNFVADLKRRRAGSLYVGYKKVNDNEQTGPQKSVDKKKKPKEKENVNVQDVAKGKKKPKFTNLYSQDKQTFLFKDRHSCDCESKSHALVNNCLHCGRIVCAQEGPGPCFFCGELVCTPDQQAVLSQNSKQSDHLYNKLMEQNLSKNAALVQRDKLLEFDKNSTKRTRVIDDESDYYQSSDSVWLSDAERKKLQKHEEEVMNQKHGSRLSKKVTLDFFGRQIIEEDEEIPELYQTPPQSLEESYSADSTCPLSEFDRPQYTETSVARNLSSIKSNKQATIWRVQDPELRELLDEGRCLSMHQPYASLLVAGIKKHEGRTWNSTHRGRLWIHAAAKVPTAEEISAVERQYKLIMGENVKFPKSYPTGCLLGCVTVVDVLPQIEYRRQYPEGESDSPFVFICKDFRELKLKFPMQGKHKIYKLDKQIHQAASKAIASV